MNYFSLDEVKGRIEKNYECIKKLEGLIPLQDTDEKKLELISFVGKMYAEYVTGVYSGEALEQQVIEIGKGLEFYPTKRPQSNQILIVMSEAGSVGGHTVLVHNWIKWDVFNRYSLVFTKMKREDVPDFIEEAVKNSGGEILCLSGTYLGRALELLNISQNFCRIILFTHMEDIIPVLSYSNKNWKIPVYFYNHADFRFSYGFSVSDIVLNLCDFDVDKTVRYRGIPPQNSIYLQFPGRGKIDKDIKISDRKLLRKMLMQKYGIKEEEKLIVSMGADFKYENIIDYEFDRYVSGVLSECDLETSFLIIGADKEKRKWVQLEKQTHGKGRALGILPRSEAELLIAGSDVYIVSFPMLASGKMEAERAGIPWLCLDIIGRGTEPGDLRFANTIGELIEKTLDVLRGNPKEYLPKSNLGTWTKEEWLEKWKEICEKVTVHSVHRFCSRRHIEKQEYVNCQLMQENAALKIYGDLMINHKELMKLMLELDQRYEMGLLYKRLNFLDKKCAELSRLSRKHLQLYLTAIKWLEIKQNQKGIEEYLNRRGYHTAAIYGMSYMGSCLFNELSGSSINVVYGIDRNAEQLHSDLKIFKPSDKLDKVDIILNTTTVDNAEICKMLNIKNVPVIQMTELLDYIHEYG